MKLLLKLLLVITLFTTAIYASESNPTKEEIAKLYVATFNRAPDAGGLNYWLNDSFDGHPTLSGIAKSFFEQPETKELYPTGTSNGSFIDSIYQNLFNRAPDSGGYDYWKRELDSGLAKRDYFILMVINGALDNEEGMDKTILNNKNEVGLAFAYAGMDNVTDAKNIMADITSEENSITSMLKQYRLTSYADLILDTDKDGFEDIIDPDDDNDKIIDIYDTNSLKTAEINSQSYIYASGVFGSEKISNYAQTGSYLEIRGEKFTSKAVILIANINNEDDFYNLKPENLSSTNIIVKLPKIEGKYEIRVYENNKLSSSDILYIVGDDYPIIFDIDYPNTKEFALENDTITITGINLSNVDKLKINDISVNIASKTNSSLSFKTTDELSFGSLTVYSLDKNSNNLDILIGREVSGKVVLPKGSTYDFSDLKIKFYGREYNVNSDGTFKMLVKNNNYSSITVYADNFIYLTATIMSDVNSGIVIDTKSTAINMLTPNFINDGKSDNNQKMTYSFIENSVDKLSDNINNGLIDNPNYLLEKSEQYYELFNESQKIIEEKVVQYFNASSSNREIQKKIIDKEGFRVKRTNANGKLDGGIKISNDTMLYAGYRIVNSNTYKIIKDYSNEMFSDKLLSPQNSSYFAYASHDIVHNLYYQSSNIEILTPRIPIGENLTWDSSGNNDVSLSAYEAKLFYMTIINQVILPHTIEAMAGKISNNATRQEILKTTFNFVADRTFKNKDVNNHFSKAIGFFKKMSLTERAKIILVFTNIKVAKGLAEYNFILNKNVKNIIKNGLDKFEDGQYEKIGFYKEMREEVSAANEIIFTDFFKELGVQITKAVSKKIANEIATEIAAKIGSKFFPAIGEALIIVNEGGALIDDGMIMWDYITTKNKIDFDIVFPINISKIYPTSVNSKSHGEKIYINGDGLDKYCLDYQRINWFPYKRNCTKWYYPKVALSNGLTTLYSPDNFMIKGTELYPASDIGSYYFFLPESFKKTAEGDYKVFINQKYYDTVRLNEIADARILAPKEITIVDYEPQDEYEIEIIKISPKEAILYEPTTFLLTGKFLEKGDFTARLGNSDKCKVSVIRENFMKATCTANSLGSQIFDLYDNKKNNQIESASKFSIIVHSNECAEDETLKEGVCSTKPLEPIKCKTGTHIENNQCIIDEIIELSFISQTNLVDVCKNFDDNNNCAYDITDSDKGTTKIVTWKYINTGNVNLNNLSLEVDTKDTTLDIPKPTFSYKSNNVIEISTRVTIPQDIEGKHSIRWYILNSDGKKINFPNGNLASAWLKISSEKSDTTSKPRAFDKVMKTNQTQCFDWNTNQPESCTAEHRGQDGYYKKGLSLSLHKIASDIVSDTNSGLMWSDNIDAKTKLLNWNQAEEYCKNLKFGTYSDWLLPSSKELLSTRDYGNGDKMKSSKFTNIGNKYWSRDGYRANNSKKWYITFENDSSSFADETNPLLTRCVRYVD